MVNKPFTEGLQMTLNQVGGALGAAALIALLAFHGYEHQRVSKPKPKPASHVVVKSKVTAPKKHVELPKQPAVPNAVYHHVLPGGKLSPQGITCKYVRSFVAGKSQAELEALEKQYRVSAAQLAQYQTCLN